MIHGILWHPERAPGPVAPQEKYPSVHDQRAFASYLLSWNVKSYKPHWPTIRIRYVLRTSASYSLPMPDSASSVAVAMSVTLPARSAPPARPSAYTYQG